MRKMKGGMIPAMLPTMAGKQVLSFLAPKVASWVAGKVTGKKGNGMRLVGRSLRPLGGSLPLGSGMTLLGSKGKCAKCSHGNGMMNKLITAAKAVGKRELKNHVNYAIDNPMQAYNNVKKLVMGKGYKKAKKSKTLKVKHQSFPKQKVRIDSNQAGGTTAITLSRVFKPGHEAVPKTIKRIKKQLYK